MTANVGENETRVSDCQNFDDFSYNSFFEGNLWPMLFVCDLSTLSDVS